MYFDGFTCCKYLFPVACFFIFFLVSFDEQMFLIIMLLSILILFFIVCASVTCLKILPYPKVIKISFHIFLFFLYGCAESTEP